MGGETNLFGEDITFCVKFDKFGSWKWKCTAIHVQSETRIKMEQCETQKIAVQAALESLVEKLTNSGKLKSKSFQKGMMKELKAKGWTINKIMQTVQKQMMLQKKKK